MLSKETALTAERLRELLHYDPDTGALTWKSRPLSDFKDGKRLKAITIWRKWHATFAGYVAGCIRYTDKMHVVRVDDVLYCAHQLAWLYMTGEWQESEIDHIDLDRSNNRWSNLRPATRRQQMGNRRVLPMSGTGFKGVEKRWNRYRAYINCEGQRRRLGQFDTPEEASAAYMRAAIEIFGEEFARAQ